MTAIQEHTMKESRCCANHHADRQAVMSLALARYNFSTPEIRVLMRHVLGHVPSGRTIKRLARSAGCRLKRGRPPSTPRVLKGDMNDLTEIASYGLGNFGGNTFQFFQHMRITESFRQPLRNSFSVCKRHNVPAVTWLATGNAERQ